MSYMPIVSSLDKLVDYTNDDNELGKFPYASRLITTGVTEKIYLIPCVLYSESAVNFSVTLVTKITGDTYAITTTPAALVLTTNFEADTQPALSETCIINISDSTNSGYMAYALGNVSRATATTANTIMMTSTYPLSVS